MERARKQRGFTIIEVLIVLAVTAAMFLLVVLSINGKQDTAEFQQSINDIRSRLQQEIDQVAAGEYANTGNFTCDGTSGVLVITAGTNIRGSNNGCVYLGKVLQFGVQKTNPQQFITYTIAGLQSNTGTLASAKPAVVIPTGAPNPSYYYTTNELHYGLNVVSMSSNGTNIGAVAFISSLGQFSGGQLLSGSQTVDLIPVSATALNASPATSILAINKHLASSPVNPSNGVKICFASGGTKQSGLITIGGGGQQLTIALKIYGDSTCT